MPKQNQLLSNQNQLEFNINNEININEAESNACIEKQVIAVFEQLKTNWPELYDYATTHQLSKYDNKTIIDLALNSYLTNNDLKPKISDLLNAFSINKDQIKVVIVGQDPYPNDHAHGYAFSSLDNKVPASLKNIFKGITNSFGENYKSVVETANLIPWAEQGVFLINTRLTTVVHKPLSKSENYWLDFTKQVFALLNNYSNIVYLLWGNKAIEYTKYINQEKNLILTTSHPSPLSARHGFLESKCFSKANEYLIANNKTPIKW